jgi:hypothetical protein
MRMMYLYEQKECTVTAIVALAVRQYRVCWGLRDGGVPFGTMWRSRPGPGVMPLSHLPRSQDLLLDNV